MNRAVRTAFRRYLAAVRAALLDHDTSLITAAPVPPEDLPPDIDAWPPTSLWTTVVSRVLLPVSQRIWAAAFGRNLEPEQYARIDNRLYVDEHLRDTSERLTNAAWPDEVYERVRQAVIESHEEHEDNRQLRSRVREVLKTAEWQGNADVIARNESLAALNTGAWHAGQARADVFGEALHKQWLATSDTRTRDSHRLADGAVVPIDAAFIVGGEPLRYPHDPRGSAGETIQCRCVLNWLDDDEAADARRTYEARLPHITDNQGRPLVDTVTASDQPEQAASNNPPDNIPAKVTADGGLALAEDVADYAPTWAERVAASVPAEPPAEWFVDPQLTGPTKVRVTDTGRVYGHIAAWGTEHASLPGVTPPRNPDPTYSRFHRHPVRTADGRRIRTGPLATAGHASTEEVDLWTVMRHYDDPTFVAADVVAGEDEHGIWVAGAVRYGAPSYLVYLLDRYSQSGDWRDGELVASCAVSNPAFPLPDNPAVQALALAASAGIRQPRLADPVPRMRVEDGRIVALVAAGQVWPTPPQAPATLDGWTLYRQFRDAERVDQRVVAARRRIKAPAITAAAARVRKGTD